MKNNKLISILIIILVCMGYLLYKNNQSESPNKSPEITTMEQTEPKDEKHQIGLSNPASTYCAQNNGELEIITDADGSQFGLCKFKDFSCEEWTYFRGECDITGDAESIRQELIKKGLDLSKMKVVINKHLGKYIGASVVPVDISEGGGGGYVFAVKDEGVIKVLADGNGIISCESFKDYPEYPAYLVSGCVDSVTGDVVKR